MLASLQNKSGLMIGHFEPLHLGHIRSILYAAGQVGTLHIVITKDPNPNPNFVVTLQDKARWLQMACADLPFVKIHTTENVRLPNHEQFNNADNSTLETLLTELAIDKAGLSLFVAENHPLAQASELALPIMTTPVLEGYDSQAIHDNPVANWLAIHPEARGNYTKTVCIVGGESSGKTTLVHKLANHYGADFALEMGRHYVHTDLGGTEVGLQYSDYAPIVLDHAHAIREAVYQAKAPVTIVDTDFVTTQAFCEEYEGQTNPFVAACIDEFRMDYTIILDNNVPWVDDGMRTLGSDNDRSRFENRLYEIFERHSIQPYRIDSDDYHQRYLGVVDFIDKHVYGKKV